MKELINWVILASIAVGIVRPLNFTNNEGALPYYLDANSARYEAFQERNPDMPFERVVALVNANADAGFYNEIEIVHNPTDVSVLLNQNFVLPPGFEPDDLEPIGGGKLLRSEAAAAFIEMRDAATQAGLNLVVASSYRTHGSQAASYNLILEGYGRESADRNVARPGHSEHQLGLAIDVFHRQISGAMTSARFQDTREYAWLLENGHMFGFILRYPREMRDILGYVYEPWHWRYVGVEIATYMHNEEIATFEEYYGMVLAPAVQALVNHLSSQSPLRRAALR